MLICTRIKSSSSGNQIEMEFYASDNEKKISFTVDVQRDTVDKVLNELWENYVLLFQHEPSSSEKMLWKNTLEKYFPKKVGRFTVLVKP